MEEKWQELEIVSGVVMSMMELEILSDVLMSMMNCQVGMVS